MLIGLLIMALWPGSLAATGGLLACYLPLHIEPIVLLISVLHQLLSNCRSYCLFVSALNWLTDGLLIKLSRLTFGWRIEKKADSRIGRQLQFVSVPAARWCCPVLQERALARKCTNRALHSRASIRLFTRPPWWRPSQIVRLLSSLASSHTDGNDDKLK